MAPTSARRSRRHRKATTPAARSPTTCAAPGKSPGSSRTSNSSSPAWSRAPTGGRTPARSPRRPRHTSTAESGVKPDASSANRRLRLRRDEPEPFRALVLGRNGAGKSTTVDCVAGLCAPDQGRIRASFYRHPADIAGLLAMLDLTEKRNTRYRRLSGGQKQRLSLALALVGRPEIVFLDEATAGMDPQARRLTWNMIRNLRDMGVTVLFTTHYLE